MNLQNFKEVYTKIITESTDDSELKQYIKTIVEEIIGEDIQAGGRKKANQIVISKKLYPKLHAAIRDVQEPVHQKMGWPIMNYFDPEEHDEASFRAEHARLEKILDKPVKTNKEIKEIEAFLKPYNTKPKYDAFNKPGGSVRSKNSGLDDEGYPLNKPVWDKDTPRGGSYVRSKDSGFDDEGYPLNKPFWNKDR